MLLAIATENSGLNAVLRKKLAFCAIRRTLRSANQQMAEEAREALINFEMLDSANIKYWAVDEAHHRADTTQVASRAA